MGCYVIDINPAALGADSISVTDFRGNVFAMPKKFSNLTPGEYNDQSDLSQERNNLINSIAGSSFKSASYESWTPSYTTATLTWR